MARVLVLSSHVAFGSVGLAVIVPALQRLGHEVMALPTIVLSNHPGYGRFSGEQIAPLYLDQIMDSLDANGWIEGIDAVLTGYLPTQTHVTTAAGVIARVRAANADALVVCDPVSGDEPTGLYLDAAVLAATAEQLFPQCDITTPNRFELSWLAGAPIESPEAAVVAARALGTPAVLATSIPADGGRLATLLVSDQAARACFVPRRKTAPHGTGDLLAALYLGHVLNGAGPEVSLGCAVAAVDARIMAADGRDELPLAEAGTAETAPLPVASI